MSKRQQKEELILIKVIDAMCGSGKSTAIFKLMNSRFIEDLSSKYIYVTPFLSEIDTRIPEELPLLDFKTPINVGNGKLESLKSLVKNGSNIATTHVLFSMLDVEVVDMIVDAGYILVIDEALNCIRQESDLTKRDIEALLKSGMVNVDYGKRGKMCWNESFYPEHDGKYKDVRNMCHLGVAYTFKDRFLMFEIPPKLLQDLPEVYVLTYLFAGSDMRCWLEMNNIEYSYMDNFELGLVPESELKAIVRDNLTILEPRSLKSDNQRNGTLSKTWFDKASKEPIKKYKNMLRSVVSHLKIKVGEVFWTTFKSHQTKLQGNSYTKGISDDMPAFLPLNTRATNDYRDYRLCMYACNVFKSPVLVDYITSHGVNVNEDIYSLGEMIQFIWRGRIRQNQPMDVLILSHRMRNLLKEWLYD